MCVRTYTERRQNMCQGRLEMYYLGYLPTGKKNLVSLCVERIVCVEVVGVDCLRRYLYRLKGLRTFTIYLPVFRVQRNQNQNKLFKY